MTDRERLIRELRLKFNARNDIDLMNILQLRGLVSDLCVYVAEVPSVDFVKAYNATI